MNNHARCRLRQWERQDEARQHGENIHGRLCLVSNGGPQQGEVHPGVQDRETDHLGPATS